MKKIISFALVFFALLTCAALAENVEVKAPQNDGTALEKSLPAPAADGEEAVKVDRKAMTRALLDTPEAPAAPAKPLSGLWAVGGHAYLGAAAPKREQHVGTPPGIQYLAGEPPHVAQIVARIKIILFVVHV